MSPCKLLPHADTHPWLLYSLVSLHVTGVYCIINEGFQMLHRFAKRHNMLRNRLDIAAAVAQVYWK